jgi:predicted GNAT family acetyltransferase
VHTRILPLRHGVELVVRPLDDGDVTTVRALFARLGDHSRRARFNGPKPCLSAEELRQLAAVDARHHVLVAFVRGDDAPVAMAQLARTDEASAEIAFAVADEYQHRGIGAALASELVCDARAAGVTEITALAASDNPAAVALIKRVARVLEISLEGAEVSVRAAIA